MLFDDCFGTQTKKELQTPQNDGEVVQLSYTE